MVNPGHSIASMPAAIPTTPRNSSTDVASIQVLSGMALSHVEQEHRLRSVVLQHDRVRLLVWDDLGEERHLALAHAVGTETQLDHGEWVIDRPRAIHRF